MNLYRQASLTFLLVLALHSTGCVVYPVRTELEVSQSATFDGVKKVVVDTRNGGIEVRCEEGRKDVQIRAVKYAQGITLGDAREHAEQIEIVSAREEGDAGILRIAAEFPTAEPGRSMGARFEVTMPPDAGLQLETGNGRVMAVGCKKDVHVQTSNGSVEARDLGAALNASTTNGRIVARNVAGDVDVSTSNGSVELDHVGNQSVRASSTNGSVRVLDSRGAATVRTSNGSIELRLTSVPKSPQIEAVTSNGRIEVEIPNDINARLNMHTSNGRIRTSLDNIKMSDFESGRSHMRATLNDGSGKLDIQSSNGSITLRSIGAKPLVSIGWEEGVMVKAPFVTVTVETD